MYVAWALVFILSTGSATVVVLYGIQFKNVKSLQWLFSSCVSLVQDVLITQPLKVQLLLNLGDSDSNSEEKQSLCMRVVQFITRNKKRLGS